MAVVLVADDVLEGRDLVRVLFGAFGHTVVEAGNGLEALESAMPDCDGYELVHRLHSQPWKATVTVVYYSAACLDNHTRKVAAACGVSHVSKPGNPEDIPSLIAARLGVAPAPAESLEPDLAEVHARTAVNTRTRKAVERERTQQELRRGQERLAVAPGPET